MIKNILFTILFSLFCLTSWADTVTYYFNSYDNTLPFWDNNPERMVDNVLANYASGTAGILPEGQRLNVNTCPGTDLGTISKVELRVYGYCSANLPTGIILRPVFTGGQGTNQSEPITTTPSWSSYFDITSDTNAPSPWTWSAVDSLDATAFVPGSFNTKTYYASKVEIRVTYTVARRIIFIQ